MIYEDVEKLVGVLTDCPTLTEIEVCQGDRTVRLRRAPAAYRATGKRSPLGGDRSSEVRVENPTDADLGVSSVIAGPTLPTVALVHVSSEERLDPPTRVTAGLVGVFHAHRVTAIGLDDVVAAGQVLGQIEAMRLMNEIVAAVGGRILSVLVADGQPVEYGQALFEIVPI